MPEYLVFWLFEGRDPRILVPEWWATFIIAVLAVWIGLWSPQYWKLFMKGCKLLIKGLHWLIHLIYSDKHSATGTAEDEVKDRSSSPSNQRGERLNFSRTLARLETPEKVITKVLPHVLKSDVVKALFALTICASFIIAIATAGYATSNILLDDFGLAKNAACGAWEPNGSNSSGVLMGEITETVASYFWDCFESDPSIQNCPVFTDKGPYFNISVEAECPFTGDVCDKGNGSIISLDTGYVDSRELGLNSLYRPLFRRRTICSPLETVGYVIPVTNSTSGLIKNNFIYGSKINSDTNVTYIENRSPMYQALLLPTGYEVKAVSETLGQFLPIDELESAMGHVFLAFVNTFNIKYPIRSDDPIFPAVKTCNEGNQTCWTNNQTHASVLGCTEFAEICPPSSSVCYDVFDPATAEILKSATWPGAEETYLVWFGLKYSDFWSLLQTRHSFMLDATRRIVGNKMSQALDPGQWKLEVQRLFSMALLRTKWEMLSVVKGTRENLSGYGYTNNLPDHFRGVCQKFLFQVGGYKNVSLLGVLVAFFGPLLLGVEYEKRALIVWFLFGNFKLVELVWLKSCRLMRVVSLAVCHLLSLVFIAVFGQREPLVDCESVVSGE